MNIDAEYYENDVFWNDSTFGDADIERIKFVSKIIPSDVSSILDVGCGNGLFLNYLYKNFDKYSRLQGVDRCETALKHVKTSKIKSCISSLPFNNNEFDLVSALEVIEHLPNNIFKDALNQICRVSSKYILLSVPNNESLENTLIKCPQCKTMFNPDYHMRGFSEIHLAELLIEYGFKCLAVYSIGTYPEYILVSRAINLINALKGRKNPFNAEIPCPVCGNYLEANSCNFQEKKLLQKQKFKNIFKSLLPSTIKYRWIVGLYQKI